MSSNVNEDRNTANANDEAVNLAGETAKTTGTPETAKEAATERIAPAEATAATEPIAPVAQPAQAPQTAQPAQPVQPAPATPSQPTPQQPASPAQPQSTPQQFQQAQPMPQPMPQAASAAGQPAGQPFAQQPPLHAAPGMPAAGAPIASVKPAKKPNAWALALKTIDKRVWAILAAGALVFGLAGGAVSAGLISAFRGDARSGYGVSRRMRMSGSFQGADGNSQGTQNGQSGQSGSSSDSLDSSARAF